MLKKVAIENGCIAMVFHSQEEIDNFIAPENTEVTIEQREMVFSEEGGWQETGAIKPPSEIEKLKADIMYLSIMTGVEL